MRTVFYHCVLVVSLIGTWVFNMPMYFLKKEEEKDKYARKVAKTWATRVLWGSGSKAEVIYENGSYAEIEKMMEDREPVIYISNHQSNLDIPVLLSQLPMEFGFIAKKEMKNLPIVGFWMRKIKCIFLDRKNTRQGMKDIKKAIGLVERGNSYVIFPEGSRSKDGNLGEFKKGSFKLAIETGVKIIPLTIIGTFDIQKKGSLKVRANKKVKIIVDEPINYKELTECDRKNIHVLVNEIVRNNFIKYNN